MPFAQTRLPELSRGSTRYASLLEEVRAAAGQQSENQQYIEADRSVPADIGRTVVACRWPT